ncbi:NACHT domain-containing protein [Streptomyces sp. TLI_185]|uniref:NACHT domain-containing protein n=1 Tax=Streptomyces sp. TLI_185 TaxID=2485151 RepID=UPI000F4DB438|nr:NACHT domain-containing protein [Streptomyces sp. TLI_185]
MRHGGRGWVPQRVGRVYLLLSLLGPGAALILARRFDLGVPATAVTVLLGLAPAYLAWASFRADRVEADPVDLDRVVDELAMAVRNQWDSEVAVRRVHDPYPLPVAWQVAPGDLAEPWGFLSELARAWPGGPPGDPALWPPDASGLAGRDGEIGQVFLERVPTRRLVILGEPGSGKSVLLIRLLQDLLARRTTTDPVPMLFSLASWDPRQPLKAWMADQLRHAHPGLTAAAPSPVALTATAADGAGDLALYLLNAGRVLPLLDGLDELPPAQHAIALDLLNRDLAASQPLVLTSRTAPYHAAMARPGTTVRLNGAAVLQLCRLGARAAADYLSRDAGGPDSPAAERWSSVVTHLGTDSPVGQALSTPLGLFLARTIYNPRPGAHPGSGAARHPDPDELCDTTAFPDRAAIDAHLFSAFIPAAYTSRQAHPPRWTAEQARHAFVFVAQFLQHQRAGSPDLAWWELLTAVPRRIRRLTVGLTVGLVAGLGMGLGMGLGVGPGMGLLWGLAAAVVIGLASARAEGDAAKLATGLRLDRAAVPFGLVVGLAAWGLVGLLGITLTAGLLFGLTFGLTSLLMGGLRPGEVDLTVSSAPAVLYDVDRRAFLLAGLLYGLPIGLSLGATMGLVLSLTIEASAVIGLGSGLAVGLAYGLQETAWGRSAMFRAYLTVRHRIPWDLPAFLQDAHQQRGVLRQVGPVYQFRHIDLQRHLAQ